MEEQGRPEKPLPVRDLESGNDSPPSDRQEDVSAAPRGEGEEEVAVVPERVGEVSAPPQGAGGEAESGNLDMEDEVRRPTPVRMAMEGTEAETSDGTMDQRTVSDPEGGGEWVVSVGGRSVSGVLPLRTVSLLELFFARVEEPEISVRRALFPGENLDDLSEDQIEQAFLASGPYSHPLRVEKEQNREDRRRRGHPKSRG